MKNIIEYLKKLNKDDRVIFFLIFTIIGNIIVAFIKFIFSLTLPSLWFFITLSS